ncbi:MAG: hypothetical protein ACKO40_03620, partial [Planctomycetaceae bacterium]
MGDDRFTAGVAWLDVAQALDVDLRAWGDRAPDDKRRATRGELRSWIVERRAVDNEQWAVDNEQRSSKTRDTRLAGSNKPMVPTAP